MSTQAMFITGRAAAPGAAGCGRLLIGRDWFELTRWHLTEDGCCMDCGTPLPGVFEARPGNWGARRQPVLLRQ